MRRQSKWKGMKNSNGLVYVGIDVHEKESQLAVLEKEDSLLLEERIPTKDLGKFLSSLPGEKRVAIDGMLLWLRPDTHGRSSLKCRVSFLHIIVHHAMT
jgi:hypothetical protein